jgi:hypothetical protein
MSSIDAPPVNFAGIGEERSKPRPGVPMCRKSKGERREKATERGVE